MSIYVSGEEMVRRFTPIEEARKQRRLEQKRRANKKYREQNREKIREINRKLYTASHCAKKIAERQHLKALVFNHYGIECVHCGDQDYESLTLDHINNDGARARKKRHPRGGHPLYGWLVRKGFPLGFQTLCFSCNCIKGKSGSNFGTLPPSRKDLIRNLRILARKFGGKS